MTATGPAQSPIAYAGHAGAIAPGPGGAPRPAWLDTVVDRLTTTGPEWFSRFLPPDEGGRESAVLILFGPPPEASVTTGEHVLLLERSHDMRSHPAQIAFPGGARDPEDDGLVATALREAQEETGLDPSGVDVLAVLPSLYLPPSGFVVAPVLGWWSEPSPVSVRDTAEVHDVLSVPVSHLLDPASRFTVTHPSGFTGPAFDLDDLLLWGFTAGLLSRVLELGGITREWDGAPAAAAAGALPRRAPLVTGGVVLDVVLVVLLLTYGYSGYRRGFISSVFSLAGFFVFAMVAAWQLPRMLARWDTVANDTRARVFGLIIGVVVLGWLGQYLGGIIGQTIRRRLGRTPWRSLDAVLGGIVVVLAASLIVWFLGGALRTVGNASLARAMSESKVLRAVNSVVPEATGEVFAGFRGFLSSQGFPQVFRGLTPEPISPVQAPDPATSRTPAIDRAGASVLKVTTASSTCQRGQEGTGWVVSDDRVVTNAHVVAGADQVQVQSRDQVLRGTVVVFDPDRDLAVIRVDGLDAAALPLGSDLARGDSAVVPGYPLDGPYRVASARVRETLDARGLDIYGTNRVVREIYSLNARVQPGNSGGPLLDDAGRVVGVVFAKSLEDDSTGYALTLAESRPVLQKATSNRAVPTGGCLVG